MHMANPINKYDQEVLDKLIACPKIITEAPRRQATLEKGSWRNNMRLTSSDKQHDFHVFIRQNEIFDENFSIGLEYLPKDGSGSFILIRYQGPHGEHTNDLLNPIPHFGYHIHKAKAEYLNEGEKPEKDAEITKKFATFQDALAEFLKDCHIQNTDQYFTDLSQTSLFGKQ